MNKTTTRQLVACAAGLVIGTQAFGWNPFKSEVTLAENGVAKAGFTVCGELLLDRPGEADDPRVGYERVL